RATLAQSGLRTVGEVLRLPRKALARRVGTGACAYLDRVLGHRAHALRAYRPPPRYAATLDLPAELTHSPALLFPLQRMLGEMCGALRGLDRSLQQFTVRLHSEQDEQALGLVMQQPTRDPAVLLRLVRERLERLRLARPVRRIGLEAGTLLVHAPAQAGLLTEPGARAADVDGLIDRLRARLGSAAVRGLRGRPDHRPEHSWAFDTPAGDAPCDALPARPAWLFPEPRPCDIGRYHVLSGPERIETGWWDGGDCRRDYFVVRDRDGALLWAYREYKPRPGWYLHGLFG
ncbi:MAG: DNA polymerase Y family protein, partial [Xanthomonadales bacterium]|nr:DNA polymerase Y family protein [Xanthomonadales bacterium]